MASYHWSYSLLITFQTTVSIYLRCLPEVWLNIAGKQWKNEAVLDRLSYIRLITLSPPPQTWSVAQWRLCSCSSSSSSPFTSSSTAAWPPSPASSPAMATATSMASEPPLGPARGGWAATWTVRARKWRCMCPCWRKSRQTSNPHPWTPRWGRAVRGTPEARKLFMH